MIRILKASAGSGKTWSLAREYISLLMQSGDPHAYRHILAVTFTNKATDEMKRRILKELDILASGGESGYMEGLCKDSGKAPETIRKMARLLLHNILNDYTAFSISTIDRFFQRTLKAFSREMGQFSSYQVALDKESLVTESVDRLLDSLADGGELLGWLTGSVRDRLDTDAGFSLEEDLYAMGLALKSEEYREARKNAKADHDRAGLLELKKTCSGIIDQYIDNVRNAALAVLGCLDTCGVRPDEFARGFMCAVEKYAGIGRNDAVKLPSQGFVGKCMDSGKWFTKANAPRLLPRVAGILDGPLNGFCDLFGKAYDLYNTACLLKSQIYSLGLSAEINKSFEDLLKEKNVLSIDDTNTILKGIIDGCDAPFIYEKTGVRYDHFLLDEFQDTSGIQWENFRPLVANSNAGGNENLIVGDVKQSIYRWRNSDWQLLGSGIEKQFKANEITVATLGSNWRSCRTVVEFNNAFYEYAAAEMDRMLGEEYVSGIYSDVRQDVKSGCPFPGSVDVIFCDKVKDVQDDGLLTKIAVIASPAGQPGHADGDGILKEIVGLTAKYDTEMAAVISEVMRLRGCGASYSDIGILARTNGDGSYMASVLLASGIPVISDESLSVKSSPAVRRLVSLLSYANNPGDSLNVFLAKSLGITPPAEYHSLADLCEYFIRAMKPEGEAPYIQAFMDTVQDWSGTGGNSLQEFLDYWDTVSPCIASPEGAEAVRIMTVHKSKGLDFQYVIFPYSEAVNMYKADTRWCRPDVDGTPLQDVADGVYRVNLTSGTDRSLFSGYYRNERKMQMVDALNTYYVATTRARKGMTIISEMPPKECCGGNENVGYKNVSQILYRFVTRPSGMSGMSCEEMYGRRFRAGTPYDFSLMDEKSAEPASAEVEMKSYPSFPLNPDGMSGRLLFSPEAGDFFSSGGQAGIGASDRLRGIVMHDILAKVIVPDDLDKALEECFRGGSIDAGEKNDIGLLLRRRIESARVRGWFPGSGAEVYRETDIIDCDGEIYRPDRVVVDGGSVTVVDYKFGVRRKEYADQVAKYAELYRNMGYADVSAYLWYVRDDEVVKVV